MSRCIKLLRSLMGVMLARPANAQTGLLTTPDGSRPRCEPDPFTHRLKLIWVSTRSRVTLEQILSARRRRPASVPSYNRPVGGWALNPWL
jgi:hypothetical protein